MNDPFAAPTSLTVAIALVLASGGLCMGLAILAFAKLPARRIREEPERKLKGPRFVLRIGLNMTLSMLCVLLFTHGLSQRLFYEGPSSTLRKLYEALAVLVVYDFLYYFLHRFPFHRWAWLKRVHAVHHRARHPRALDSLFLHPVENVLGLALLTACTWLVGPVSVPAFGVCFFVYSWLNIIVHCGVDLPGPYFGMLARKHSLHHRDMRAGNYASLSPLPDLLFGTAE